MTAPVVADEVYVELVIAAPLIVVPEVNSGSENATPTGLVLAIVSPQERRLALAGQPYYFR
jgi:hypothetical protein